MNQKHKKLNKIELPTSAVIEAKALCTHTTHSSLILNANLNAGRLWCGRLEIVGIVALFRQPGSPAGSQLLVRRDIVMDLFRQPDIPVSN